MQVPSRFTTAAGLLAVVLACLALAIPACDKQSSCRPGTLFLQVDLGPFVSGASELDVGVSVDGATVMHTSLAVKPGMQTGGIEVQFPQGYPAGKAVMVQVAVKVAGTETAIHSFTVFPGSGCEVYDVGFTGADVVTGAGGASAGTGGFGGEAGTLGGVAGTGGPAGTGGATGGSIGGTFAGGRGGAAGSAGSGGRGGTGGATGRGGTGGACRPTGPENCFNGYDDDCDGNVDCADSDCTPVAQCVALEPMGLIGAMDSGLGCGSNYTNIYTIMTGPTAGGCTGCSCRPPTVTCTATVFSFGSASACGTATMSGVSELTFSSNQPCTVPSWVGSTQGTIYGVQASTFTPSLSGGCVPAGTPTLGPIAWANTTRFCATTMVGGGCGGQACVPVSSAPRCAMFDGAHACPPGTSASYWYTGATDGRTCSCSCGTPSGASCSGVTLNVGSDFSCSTVTQTVGPGQRKCYPGAGVNSPGLVFSGAPTTPTCGGSATVSGSITPSGMKTICCLFSGGLEAPPP